MNCQCICARALAPHAIRERRYVSISIKDELEEDVPPGLSPHSLVSSIAPQIGTDHLLMSRPFSIAIENEDSKYSEYVQTVSMPDASVPQRQSYQRTFGNPVRLPCFVYSMSIMFNRLPDTSGYDGIWHCLPVLVNTDARLQERR